MLTVTGVGSVVVAGTVENLVVEASASVVHVTSAGSIEVTSDAVGAVVTWSKGEPSVQNDAVAATVHQADGS